MNLAPEERTSHERKGHVPDYWQAHGLFSQKAMLRIILPNFSINNECPKNIFSGLPIFTFTLFD